MCVWSAAKYLIYVFSTHKIKNTTSRIASEILRKTLSIKQSMKPIDMIDWQSQSSSEWKIEHDYLMQDITQANQIVILGNHKFVFGVSVSFIKTLYEWLEN